MWLPAAICRHGRVHRDLPRKMKQISFQLTNLISVKISLHHKCAVIRLQQAPFIHLQQVSVMRLHQVRVSIRRIAQDLCGAELNSPNELPLSKRTRRGTDPGGGNRCHERQTASHCRTACLVGKAILRARGDCNFCNGTVGHWRHPGNPLEPRVPVRPRRIGRATQPGFRAGANAR